LFVEGGEMEDGFVMDEGVTGAALACEADIEPKPGAGGRGHRGAKHAHNEGFDVGLGRDLRRGHIRCFERIEGVALEELAIDGAEGGFSCEQFDTDDTAIEDEGCAPLVRDGLQRCFNSRRRSL
jgi:hypothetical protein